jgi:hypothetical protein
MTLKLSGSDEIELRDVKEDFPPSSGDDCFKRNEAMRFDAQTSVEYAYCDDIKRNVAFRGDSSTFIKPGAFSLTEC